MLYETTFIWMKVTNSLVENFDISFGKKKKKLEQYLNIYEKKQDQE